ncbi:MAG: DUF4388 domain-containing protein [Deltaproteobacteria bacterium]|nr:DUF4388 domain-containing protein [Deltaproteobacteria bacterium]
MSLKGNLDTFPLPSILQLLHNDSKTGAFQANKGDEEVKIFFHEGAIIYAMGSKKEIRLGSLLLKRGLISKSELHESLLGAQEKKQALGKFLVENKQISVKILKELLQQQTEKIIYNLFIWEKGDFEYRDARLKMDGIINIQLNVVKVILEASRRIDELSIFKKQIPSDKIILKVCSRTKEKEKIKFTPPELQMLMFVNGKRSVREIFSESGFDGFGAHDEFHAYKTIHSLISSGMIKKIEPVQRGSVQTKEKKDENNAKDEYNVTEIITVYNDILQFIYRLVESELGKQASNIFIKCKSELSLQYSNLLKDFYPGNPTSTNVHAITQVLEDGMDYDKVEIFIMNCFNKYLKNIIEETSSILGGKFSDIISNEINKMFLIVNENKRNSTEIKQIKKSIEKILN